MMTKLMSRGVGILVIGLVLASQRANADVICWEFAVHPTQEPIPMLGFASDTAWPDPGEPPYTPYGGTVAGTGLQGDGTAIFADATTESANSGFVYGLTSGSFTMDVRVRVLESVNEGPGKSMTVKNDGNQRGIKLNTDRIALVNGGEEVAAGNVDLASAFKILRFSVNSTTAAVDPNIVTFYAWDAGTSTWTLVGSTSLGGSGGGGQVPFPGVGIGSLAGSSTQSGKFIIDWARVNPTEALGDTVGPMGPCEAKCESTVTPAAVQTDSGWVGGLPATYASIDMGSPDVTNGLTNENTVGSDGDTAPVVVAGRPCRMNVDPATDGFMYFAIDDDVAYQGSLPAVTISFDYFDEGTGAFGLTYDGPASEWTDAAGTVPLSDTKTWKRGSFTLTDAYFGNRQHDGSDFRIARGMNVHFYIDNVFVSHAPGPEFDYSITNSGAVDITWDVIEANADGTANDYAWVSLTKTPGVLAPEATAPVKAAVDTATLAAGTHTTYLKFTDTCTFAPYAEPFDYADASVLAGQGGWLGSGETSPFIIQTAQLQLNGGAESGLAHSVSHSVGLAVYDGVFSVKVKVKTGGASAGREANNFWRLAAFDAQGNQLGYWQGTPTTVRARNPLNANQASDPQALAADFKIMEMRSNTATKTTEYYYDGALVISYPFNNTSGLASISFERINGADTSAAEYVYFDDVDVSAIEKYHLRQISVNVVDCSLTAEPRVASASGCTGTTTRSFALINNGVSNLTELAVEQITSGGEPTTYPWLSLSVPSATLAPGESAEVVATIDWNYVSMTEVASLRFKATCGGAEIRDSLVGALTVTKMVVPPDPVILRYNGDVDPLAANSAGPGYNFSVFEGVQQGGIVADPDAVDGFAYEIDDVSTAKTKFISEPPAAFADGATLVVRMKKLGGGTYDGGRYGNIWIHAPNIATEIFWGGPSGQLGDRDRGIWTTLTASQGADESYHTIRVTAQDTGGSTGIVINVYFDENPVPVLSITNAEPRDPQAGSQDGFGFGTQGTGNTEHVYFDCLVATTAGAFPPDQDMGCLGESLTCTDSCHKPFADVDEDTDVDQADFAVFQLCYTGAGATSIPGPPDYPAYCVCLNRGDDDNDGEPNNDTDIDSFDLTAFENCASGPGVPANPDCLSSGG